jgi:Ni,Fe-hydrogenase III small subunit/formate hydrogenlyase subunit 6/NADH:ubiquinone oxidoreductase subunit I
MKMFKVVKKMIQYPRLTQDYPQKPLNNAHLFIGRPEIDLTKCTRCAECVKRCPSQAIVMDKASKEVSISYDKCIFCTLCEEVCPVGAAKMTTKFELAEKEKKKLSRNSIVVAGSSLPDQAYEEVCSELKVNIKKLLGRSLHIREVDSGSCNGCDYEINALNNPFNDIERLGINFVASPRHADMLLVTGTATRNMQRALVKTYKATPDPKLVVAVGACACSGGIFRDCYAASNGIDGLVPVDVYVPGCPPRPQAIMYGILKALDRVKK